MESQMKMNSFISNFKIPLIIFILILFFEIGVRWYTFGFHSVFQPLKYSPQAIVSTSNVIEDKGPINYRLKPNNSAWHKGAFFKTNNDGFRDDEFEMSPGGKKRIAVLGRSASFGEGVSQSSAWPKQLETIIGNRFDIMNFSVPGYNLFRVLENYNSSVYKYNPDIVIIPIFLSEWYLPVVTERVVDFSFQAQWLSLGPYIGYSFFYHNIRFAIKMWTKRYLSTDWLALAAAQKEKKSDHLKFSKLLWKVCDQLTRVEKRKVILLSLPTPVRSKRDASVSKGLQEWVNQRQNVYYFPLSEKFRNRVHNYEHIFYGDGHPSENTHNIIANAVYTLMNDF